MTQARGLVFGSDQCSTCIATATGMHPEIAGSERMGLRSDAEQSCSELVQCGPILG
jgi:hypothetical protein